jgi:hypothetical protein
MSDRLIEVHTPADDDSQTHCAINALFTDSLYIHLSNLNPLKMSFYLM